MPQRSTCTPTSLYRLEGGLALAAYLSTPEDATIDELIEFGDVQCRLIIGASPARPPAWLKQVETLTAVPLSMASQQLYGVLLVPLDGWVYALTWGGGRHLVDDELVDHAFGLRFGIRRLDATRLGRVARAALDVSARLVETAVPSGGDLGAFGAEPYGEVVTSLTGQADLTNLTYSTETGRRHQIRVGTSLWLPLPRQQKELLADLRAIGKIVEQPDDDSPLRCLNQIRPLDKHDPVLPQLDERLAEALGGNPDAGALSLGWPAQAIREIEAAGSFRVLRLGHEPAFTLDCNVELDDLTARFASMRPDERLEQLRTARIVVCGDDEGHDALTGGLAMKKWFVFETTIDHVRYCFHQARWFRIGEHYVEQIRDQVAQLLTQRSSLTFPTWVPTGKSDDEHRYCELAAQRHGYLCLDKNFARTPFHPRFELCDLVGPDGELIHVKWLGRATAASHLHTQAVVSAEALRDEPEAREQLDAKVRVIDPNRRVPDSPTVVLAIAGRGWNVDQLFTLSQASLLRLSRSVRFLGADLQFAELPFVAKPQRHRGRRAA